MMPQIFRVDVDGTGRAILALQSQLCTGVGRWATLDDEIELRKSGDLVHGHRNKDRSLYSTAPDS